MSSGGVKFEGLYKGLVEASKRQNNIRNKTVESYRDALRLTLHYLLEASPQWSGYFASNWRISYPGVSGGSGGLYLDAAADFGMDRFKLRGGMPETKQTIHQRGDLAAIAYAKQINEPLIEGVTSAAIRVTFKNDTPYGKQIEKNKLDAADATLKQIADGKVGKKYLRPVNVISPTPIPIAYAKLHMAQIAAKLK